MQLRADIQLQTAIRALTEVVAPALDSNNAMAVEQLQIVIGMLHLVAAQLPLQARYDRDELARLLELGLALVAAVDRVAHAPVITSLTAAGTTGETVLSHRASNIADILAVIRELRTHTGALISAIFCDGNDTERERVMALVLAHADAQLLRERAWVATMGWESQPESVPSIIDLLK